MLLLSRFMLSRPSDIHPLKTVVALAALALVAGRAQAGHSRPAPHQAAVQVSSQKDVEAGEMEVAANGVDAERVFQGDSSSARATSSGAAGVASSDLSPLPASDAFDATSGEVRGRQLLRAMADLPQVGATSGKSSLSLDFWDDSTSARSAVDDRTPAPDLTTQGNARLAAHSNVAIPLPMAAWSALSVFGGMGFTAAARRLAKRLK